MLVLWVQATLRSTGLEWWVSSVVICCMNRGWGGGEEGTTLPSPLLSSEHTQALRPGEPCAWQMVSIIAADLPDLGIQGPAVLTWTLFLVLVQKKEHGMGSQKRVHLAVTYPL